MAGLGDLRRRELEESCNILVPGLADVTCLDDPELPDGPMVRWSPDRVAQRVEEYVSQHRIETVYTFDAGGVSGHPNHADTATGVSRLLTNLEHRRRHGGGGGGGDRAAVAALTGFKLVTTTIVQKYAGVLDAALTNPAPAGHSSDPVFFSSAADVAAIWAAMRAHATQLVWFRRLYLVFSRYVYINTFIKIRA